MPYITSREHSTEERTRAAAAATPVRRKHLELYVPAVAGMYRLVVELKREITMTGANHRM